VTPRRTKIVCTIGPASSTPERIDSLVAAGMDAARFNFSHGSHEEHAERATLIREAQERAGRPLALIADLQGPKLRVGKLPRALMLVEGDQIDVTGQEDGRAHTLPISPPVLQEVLQPGHDVLIDDGRVRLRVDEVDAVRARATVLVGGSVESHKGVNLPASRSLFLP
jgi:pyruvate kinase